jgi:hypothetical protein
MAVDIHREIHQGLDEVTADRREFIREVYLEPFNISYRSVAIKLKVSPSTFLRLITSFKIDQCRQKGRMIKFKSPTFSTLSSSLEITRHWLHLKRLANLTKGFKSLILTLFLILISTGNILP